MLESVFAENLKQNNSWKSIKPTITQTTYMQSRYFPQTASDVLFFKEHKKMS